MSRFGDKSSTDLAAKLASNGNVLQVWINGRKPPRGRSGLIKGGVEASRDRIQQQWQGVDICALELGELAIIEHQPRHLVFGRELLKDVHGSRDRLAFS